MHDREVRHALVERKQTIHLFWGEIGKNKSCVCIEEDYVVLSIEITSLIIRKRALQCLHEKLLFQGIKGI